MKKLILVTLLGLAIMRIMASDGDTPLETNESFSLESQYLFETFTNGKIYFKDGTVGTLELNYNVLIDEIHFKENESTLTFLKNTYSKIDRVEIGGHHFIFVKSMVFEIIYESDLSLLKRITPTKKDLFTIESAYGITSSTHSSSGSLTQIQSVYANTAIPNAQALDDTEGINVEESFRLLQNTNVYSAAKLSFIKLYKDNKGEIKDYIDNNNLNLNKKDDLLALVRYCKTF